MQRERDLWIGISFLKKKTGILSDFSNIFMILFLIVASSLIRSFSIDDGNGTFKTNSRCSFQTFSSLLQFAEKVKCRLISLELISWRPHSSLDSLEEKETFVVACLRPP